MSTRSDIANARSKLSFEERVLLRFARDPAAPEIGATASYTLENCLEFARCTIDGFDDRVRAQRVLDYGCGPGFQSVAMRIECGAKSVFGLDIVDEWIPICEQRARQAKCEQQVFFGTKAPSHLQGNFDVVVSLNAFEHYKNPELELRHMCRQLKRDGLILLAFAEPWYSHSGSHFNNYTNIPVLNRPVPWLNLLFSDRAMLTLRSRFREERPQTIEDSPGGLNRMTVARFERIIGASGMNVRSIKLFATCGIPLITRVPVLRELLTSAVSCVLQKS